MPRLLCAPDKFRGTASAAQIAAAMADGARNAGWDALELPISDGGEGLLECFGGANRHAEVAGPLGAPVRAGWRLDGTRAVIEMAAASGLALVGAGNDPVRADTRGTGQLIRTAIDAGAREVIVGAGGSAGTDGGLGAVEELRGHGRLDGTDGVRVVVATDVRTRFADAAVVFAAQKGADEAQLPELTGRLERLVHRYRAEFGVDVGDLDGAGAAGGLAGGLAALGASIRSGFDLVAEHLDLAGRVRSADLVATGEGRLDATSTQGKAVGSLAALCGRLAAPLLVVAGRVDPGCGHGLDAVDLTATYGAQRARRDVTGCVREAMTSALTRFAP